MKIVVLGSQEMIWESQELVDEFLKGWDVKPAQISVAIEDTSTKEAKNQIARLLESVINEEIIVMVVEDIAATAAMILMAVHECLPELIHNVYVLDPDGTFHSVYSLCVEVSSELLNTVSAKESSHGNED